MKSLCMYANAIVVKLFFKKSQVVLIVLLDSRESHDGQHTAAPQNVGHVPQ